MLLPLLANFSAHPTDALLEEFLEALEGVFLGEGGRAFLGQEGWDALNEGVERCWVWIDLGRPGVDAMQE